MLPAVNFCGLRITRLVLGANPFAGFSHQTPQRDQEMKGWNTPGRIIETWERAWSAGINAMVTNNTTPHVVGALETYLRGGGAMQWIAQVNNGGYPSMAAGVDRCVRIGCKALFFHGGPMDTLYEERDEATLTSWVEHARQYGVPIGVAGHSPELHDWVAALDLVDFHVIPFFNCGSVHAGKGDRFRLADVPRAVECIRRIDKPCIAYKILGAGRIDAAMGFEYALTSIKPGDVVNVGMHRGDRDRMVEENAELVRGVLAGEPVSAGR